ncbi:MAG: molybdopterin-binding protein [Pseudomonadota bacterium]|nr:molybdopterin-binding protein [Pseudomonadota bacterium]
MKKTFTLMRARQRDRRHLLRGAVAAAGSALLAGCDRLSQNESFVETLKSAQHLSRAAQKIVAPRPAMAQEFGPGDVAQTFRGNGSLDPGDADYVALREAGFAGYRLAVGGLVAKPAEFTLEQLRTMPARTQITRHDCVEGWSCIGKWKGVQLAPILDQVQPKPEAKFVVFRCYDSMDGPALDGRDSRYYESIDLDDAHHVQTILAYELNDKALPVSNGAPLRCRVERQLGYKQAKYIRAIELVESFAQIRAGKGGYWEDEGYEWYGGI